MYLLVVLSGGAEDGQLRPAWFGFGRLAGVEEGLDERLQVLSFLENNNQQDIIRFMFNKSLL